MPSSTKKLKAIEGHPPTSPQMVQLVTHEIHPDVSLTLTGQVLLDSPAISPAPTPSRRLRLAWAERRGQDIAVAGAGDHPPPDQRLGHGGGFDVTDSATSTELRRRLGYLPQHFRYVPSFTARDFVLYVAWLKKVPNALAAARTEEVLERVGLSEQAATVMRRLSGGMVRRVGIAQALVNDPQVLLLDEPTAGLDPQQRIAFRKLVRELGWDRVVLLSTHLVEDVGAACDEVHVLSEGSLRFSGSPHGLQELAGTASEGDSELERGYSTALE